METISDVSNHLWQSTAFAVAVGLMTMVFRQNRAQVRYWLWLAASLKFLLPFSLLMSVGNRLDWAPATRTAAVSPNLALTVVQMSQPFPDTLPRVQPTQGAGDWIIVAIVGVWLCGVLGLVLLRCRGWLRIRVAVGHSTPLHIPATVEVRSTPGLMEPGVVGLFHPVLLLPAGLAEHLTRPQLEAVLAHELCHVRRRDNLTSAMHMLVEAAFWFHPLIWWIGARLMEERERACDEAVLSLGNEPHDYAEGILKICKSYIETPLSCVSGVTGSNLKKRLQAILTGRVPGDVNLTKKLLLGITGMVAFFIPIVVGVIHAPVISALTPTRAVAKLEAATIKTCSSFQNRPLPEIPGRLQSGCTSVERLLERAYGVFADGHMNPLSSVTVTGGPAWTNTALYEIDAEGHESQAMMDGPMLQRLLEDRFKLKIHREVREVPVYNLTLGKDPLKVQPFQGTCTPWDSDNPPNHHEPELLCGSVRNVTSDGLDFHGATMSDLCFFAMVTLGRPVIDKTRITGRFDLHLELPTKELGQRARGMSAFSNPAPPPPTEPSIVSAVITAVKKLGLNLEPARGGREFVVIDHVERPSEN